MGEFRKPWYFCCAKGVNPFRTRARTRRLSANEGGAESRGCNVSRCSTSAILSILGEGGIAVIGQAQGRDGERGEGIPIRACNVGKRDKDKNKALNQVKS